MCGGGGRVFDMSSVEVCRVMGFERTVVGRLAMGKCRFRGRLNQHLCMHKASRRVHCVHTRLSQRSE